MDRVMVNDAYYMHKQQKDIILYQLPIIYLSSTNTVLLLNLCPFPNSKINHSLLISVSMMYRYTGI